MTILYALGWTQHSVGSQNIRTMAMIQLLLGNIGMAGRRRERAARPLQHPGAHRPRRCSRTCCPGYLTPADARRTSDVEKYIDDAHAQAAAPGQMSYWQNYPKFLVCCMKAWCGKAATKENDWAYDYLPKLDKLYDVLAVFDLMYQGKHRTATSARASTRSARAPEQGEGHRRRSRS